MAIPEGFGNNELYERMEGGGFKKKKKYEKPDSERRLVIEICICLHMNDVEYKVEYEAGGRDCDIYLPDENLGMECKISDWSKKIDEAIEQCKTYSNGGIDVAVVVPRRTPSRRGNINEGRVIFNDIPFVEFDANEHRFNVVYGDDVMFLESL